jgi:hypothetical protein
MLQERTQISNGHGACPNACDTYARGRLAGGSVFSGLREKSGSGGLTSQMLSDTDYDLSVSMLCPPLPMPSVQNGQLQRLMLSIALRSDG